MEQPLARIPLLYVRVDHVAKRLPRQGIDCRRRSIRPNPASFTGIDPHVLRRVQGRSEDAPRVASADLEAARLKLSHHVLDEEAGSICVAPDRVSARRFGQLATRL